MIDLKKVAKWKNDFEHAFELNTSGSQGHALEKILYEEMHEFENLEEYKSLEMSASALSSLGAVIMPDVLLKSVKLTCELLIERIYMEANFEDARMREEAWYDKTNT
jgi:hypothetical protein